MTGPTRVALFWSGGKDSALALHLLAGQDDVRPCLLITLLEAGRDVSTVHETPVGVLRAQAASLGLPLRTVEVGPNLEGYAAAMADLAADLRAEGVGAVAFGDLPVSGALQHRRASFERTGLQVLAPLWGLSSQEGVDLALQAGFRAVVVAVDAAVLGPGAVGRALTPELIADLPAGADPAGELGEYHTFVHDGPGFTHPVQVAVGRPRRVTRLIGTTQGSQTFLSWVGDLRVQVETG